jgi:hypothetical protein
MLLAFVPLTRCRWLPVGLPVGLPCWAALLGCPVGLPSWFPVGSAMALCRWLCVCWLPSWLPRWLCACWLHACRLPQLAPPHWLCACWHHACWLPQLAPRWLCACWHHACWLPQLAPLLAPRWLPVGSPVGSPSWLPVGSPVGSPLALRRWLYAVGSTPLALCRWLPCWLCACCMVQVASDTASSVPVKHSRIACLYVCVCSQVFFFWPAWNHIAT